MHYILSRMAAALFVIFITQHPYVYQRHVLYRHQSIELLRMLNAHCAECRALSVEC